MRLIATLTILFVLVLRADAYLVATPHNDVSQTFFTVRGPAGRGPSNSHHATLTEYNTDLTGIVYLNAIDGVPSAIYSDVGWTRDAMDYSGVLGRVSFDIHVNPSRVQQVLDLAFPMENFNETCCGFGNVVTTHGLSAIQDFTHENITGTWTIKGWSDAEAIMGSFDFAPTVQDLIWGDEIVFTRDEDERFDSMTIDDGLNYLSHDRGGNSATLLFDGIVNGSPFSLEYNGGGNRMVLSSGPPIRRVPEPSQWLFAIVCLAIIGARKCSTIAKP